MKQVFTLFIGIFISLFASAQDVQSGTLKYNGANYPCDVIEYNLPPDETEKIIKDRMKSLGYTPEKGKGLLVYRNVTIGDLSFGQPQDLIFSVDRKDRKHSDISVVSLITAKAGEIPTDKVKGAGKSIASITTSPSASAFLNSFQSQVNNQAYNLSVIAKSDEIKKAEKKLDDLKKDQTKLEKKIKDLQSDLQSNLKDQDTQSSQIDALKKQLDEMKKNAPGQ